MKTYFFSLQMPFAECEALYYSEIKNVVMRSEDGQNVQVPKQNVKHLIRPEGIVGRFKLVINNANKMVSFERIS